MKERIANYILTSPKKCLALCLLVFASLSPFLLSLEEDYSIRIWFHNKDPLIKELDRMGEIFGNDEKIAIGIHIPSERGGIFTSEAIQLIQEITEEAWKLPYVVSVNSLTNSPYSSINQDEFLIEAFIDDSLEITPQLLEKKKEIALNDPMIAKQFIDKKGETTIIFGSLRSEMAGPIDYQKLTSALNKLTLKFQDKTKGTFYLVGTAILSDAYREVSKTDLIKVLPFMLVFVIVILLFAFHSVTAVALLITTMGLTILSSFGLASLIGIKFNNISSVVPGILMAICLADGIHLYVSYLRRLKQSLNRKQAMHQSIVDNLTPTFLTTISTVIGFLSLAATELVPVRNLGILAGFGTFYAWLLTLLFFAPLIVLLPSWNVKSLANSKIGNNILKYIQQNNSQVIYKPLLNFLDKYKSFIITFVALVSLISIGVGLQNEVNSEPLKQIAPSLKVRKDAEYLRDKFQGYNGPHIMIDSGRENGVKDPQFLRKVQNLIQQIEKNPKVNRVNSIIRLIKRTNQNLNQDNPHFYKIPSDKKKIAEILLFYQMGLPQGMGLGNRLSLDGRYLRLSILWSYSDSKSSLNEVERISRIASELGLEAKITGKMMLYYRMTSYIVSTFFKSISIALVLITLMMIIALRSFKLGLLALLPNLIPLVIGLAVMTLLKMPIDMASSMIVSICLGIAVDDTVHFLTHFYEQRRNGNNIRKSLEMVFHSTAPALVLTTLILSVSFAMFLLGDFVPNQNFGIISALVLIIALLTDLLLLPAMLLKFKAFSR